MGCGGAWWRVDGGGGLRVPHPVFYWFRLQETEETRSFCLWEGSLLDIGSGMMLEWMRVM